MRFKESLAKLKKSSNFRNWKKEHEESFLSYGFIMIDPDVKKEWQLGYYNPKKDTITTFTVDITVMKNPDSEIFKNNKNVMKLNKEKVKLNYEEALKIAKKIQEDKYPGHSPIKEILILQNLEIGQIWNITYITHTFKTLNIKIDSESGDVVKYDLIDLFKVDS